MQAQSVPCEFATRTSEQNLPPLLVITYALVNEAEYHTETDGIRQNQNTLNVAVPSER
jgi:hypothetical protein